MYLIELVQFKRDDGGLLKSCRLYAQFHAAWKCTVGISIDQVHLASEFSLISV